MLPRALNPILINCSSEVDFFDAHVQPPLVPYEGPIFEANRYLKKVTVTFRGLLRERLWQ